MYYRIYDTRGEQVGRGPTLAEAMRFLERAAAVVAIKPTRPWIYTDRIGRRTWRVCCSQWALGDGRFHRDPRHLYEERVVVATVTEGPRPIHLRRKEVQRAAR